MEYSSCGVGFIASLKHESSHETLSSALKALKNVEHRGGTDRSGNRGDGAGVMTAIPWELFGKEEGKYAIATIFAPQREKRYQLSLDVFERVFASFELFVDSYREIPLNTDALDPRAMGNCPRMLQVFIKRPEHCRTLSSFDELLYHAKQKVRSEQKDAGIKGEFFFTSLSSRTIVYKALATSAQLEEFYPDLQNPKFKTHFALFHRRYSTNTLPSWDKVQPFRLIGHNGEINTIEGNKAVAFSREKSIGLRRDQLLTHEGTSDSGNLNGMVEALKYRSSIPHLNEVLAIMIPPARKSQSNYYQFWSRAMEPWDGPALVAFCDGKRIGARLDRNGFRPCRWQQTKDTFYLCSEAGSFEIAPEKVIKRGVLYAGRSVNIHLHKGSISFKNPDQSNFYREAFFDSRLTSIGHCSPLDELSECAIEEKLGYFYYTKEDLNKELFPTIDKGKGPIGSMGDTARLPVLSHIHRSLYDYFFQNFAQVTNPPLDYLREELVTDLSVNLGRQPNIFEPKELIPPPVGIKVAGPILGLGQLETIIRFTEREEVSPVPVEILDICFDRKGAEQSFQERIEELTVRAISTVKSGVRILILSDRQTSFDRPAIPSILVMRAIQLELNRQGIRLRVSLIVDSGEIRTPHQIAVLISFGASAVCPYLALNLARQRDSEGLAGLGRDQKENRLIKAMESGLLKIMAKRGISVVRSYRGSELFSIMGLDRDMMESYFPHHSLHFGGLGTKELVREILSRTAETQEEKIPHNFIYKEHAAGKVGEKHSLTSKRSRLLHQTLEKESDDPEAQKLWQQYNRELEEHPINLRDLLDFKKEPIELAEVCGVEKILPRFGSGAMSFGSISAESQRDLIHAFREIGGRSNSGEGGENPYYFKDGTTASIKQIASGRFGVTAQYLTTSGEVQIKIAQGAKPGEGGQLMGVKVNQDIARARFSAPGVDLISPPPQHDIYSIEDLAQLIYEIKQLKPDVKVSVKLVSEKNIGAIAMGVVKAGADAIQISGGAGGTGAADLLSMKHAGLPWEIGLSEVHRHLSQAGLRQHVVLRTDGGLLSALDIIKATLLGAEEYDFGKLVLVSQGCIMARVCEKNTCPTGIATQDPKFKARYKGNAQKTVKLLKLIAHDVRHYLSQIGVKDLKDIVGRSDLLIQNEKFQSFCDQYNIDISYFLTPQKNQYYADEYHHIDISPLNEKLLKEYRKASHRYQVELKIKSTDRAVATTLAGEIAASKNAKLAEVRFIGSAGQGFGAFLCDKMTIHLEGEANDGVAKSMSGGSMVIIPHRESHSSSAENVLVGNACLYGATGGSFYLDGLAGDRFCVRNSGATAVALGAGLHACEYMTGGCVAILGPVLENLGAGMTGGRIYTLKSNSAFINKNYIKQVEIDVQDEQELRELITNFQQETASTEGAFLLDNLELFAKFIPHS